MAYMRIHCGVCGGIWEIYHRDDWNDDRARQCPHCFNKIDRQAWTNQILPAFGAMQDANAELFKDSTGLQRPLFSFDVIADHLYQNQRTGCDTCPFSELETILQLDGLNDEQEG